METNSISAPARSRLAGTSRTLSLSGTVTTVWAIGVSSMSTSYTPGLSVRLDTPSPVVALPCGSRSTTRTLLPSSPRAAARFTTVVVLPTPPFWLATVTIMRPPRSWASPDQPKNHGLQWTLRASWGHPSPACCSIVTPSPRVRRQRLACAAEIPPWRSAPANHVWPATAGPRRPPGRPAPPS
jgi:hypothetical protein